MKYFSNKFDDLEATWNKINRKNYIFLTNHDLKKIKSSDNANNNISSTDQHHKNILNIHSDIFCILNLCNKFGVTLTKNLKCNKMEYSLVITNKIRIYFLILLKDTILTRFDNNNVKKCNINSYDKSQQYNFVNLLVLNQDMFNNIEFREHLTIFCNSCEDDFFFNLLATVCRYYINYLDENSDEICKYYIILFEF